MEEGYVEENTGTSPIIFFHNLSPCVAIVHHISVKIAVLKHHPYSHVFPSAIKDSSCWSESLSYSSAVSPSAVMFRPHFLLIVLKGKCHEIFDYRFFFMKSVSRNPL